MELKNRKTIGVIVLASILGAGMFAFIPGASGDLTALDKIGTIINILLNIQNTTNNIEEDLADKLKLIVGVDTGGVGFGNNENSTITISARNHDAQFVTFNLKEVYVCGTIEGPPDFGQIRLKEVRIEGGNIVIRDSDGSELDSILVAGVSPTSSCADILTLLSDGDGRAGVAGLGSDTDIVIEFNFTTTGQASGLISFVKCIAFVPQEAEFLVCHKFP